MTAARDAADAALELTLFVSGASDLSARAIADATRTLRRAPGRPLSASPSSTCTTTPRPS